MRRGKTMAEAVAAGPAGADAGFSSDRAHTQARQIGRYKLAVLGPLGLVLAGLLLPVLFLQLYFSFHAYSPYLGSWWDAEFIGIDLFYEVLVDTRFWLSVARSLYFAVGSTIGCFLIGFLLAFLIHRPFFGRGMFYIAFIVPMLTVPIVVAYTAEMLLYQNGPINGIISRLTGTDINVAWLSNADLALTSVMILEIWNWTPFSFIIMLAGLSALPREPVEAAQILGASRWRIFVEIQLPLLRPVIVLALVLRFLEAMAEFPKIWSLFQGGPGSATETIPVLIYLTTWNYFDISRGAAMSYITMMLMVGIVLAAIWLLRRERRAIDHIYASEPSPA
jgi:multiple sugar transport system permease protein